MKTKQPTKIIVMYDSQRMIVIDSVLMFGSLLLMLDLNYRRWGGSWLVTLAFFIAFVVFALSKGSPKVMRFSKSEKQKAIDYINSL